MPGVAELTTGLLGTPTAAHVARAVTARRLRVLAYHGVPDPAAFRAQMDHLARFYAPISGSTVVAVIEGREPLPPDAVWITFDDGHPDVLDNAGPILDEFGIPATLFVVAGLIDTEEPFWWTVVERAHAQGLADRDCLARLKRSPDPARRAAVEDLTRKLAEREGRRPTSLQLTSDQLRHWLATGQEVGNHSWDHPCLDRSSPEGQVRQIREAHAWLTSLLGYEPRLFAYPNGNWSPVVDNELRALHYAVALLFDHHLARPSGDSLRMSRLRIDSTAALPRFRAIVSGTHPGAFAAQLAARRLLKTRRPEASRAEGM